MRIASLCVLAVASWLALVGPASAQDPGPQPPGPITVIEPQTYYDPMSPKQIDIGVLNAGVEITIIVKLAAPTDYAFQWSDANGASGWIHPDANGNGSFKWTPTLINGMQTWRGIWIRATNMQGTNISGALLQSVWVTNRV